MSLFAGRDGCLVVAEVGQAHDGSLGMAHAYIDAAADTGADGIKFQTHIAAAESTLAEPWRVKFSPQDETRFDYWRRMEFTATQWRKLHDHAKERGLIFLSSPFSREAVAMLGETGIDGWKIASGEVTNTPMLREMSKHPRPVLLSTGMSTWQEIDDAVAAIRELGLPVGVFQCTSMYPTPPEKLGLNVIGEMRARYDCPVGLSDHSGGPFAALAAATVGIEMLEVHVAFDRRMFGPDVPASLTFDDLRTVVDGIRFIETAKANPVNKDAVADDLSAMRKTFGKSLVAIGDLAAGTTLTEANLGIKKPGSGLPPAAFDSVRGRTLARDVVHDQTLQEDDLA
jgi:N,N'-diacetyllegionaminate synthase